MRPAPASSPAAAVAGAAASATSAEAPPAAPALPTLKITRMSGSAGALSALVDDTWVRRGDVVAGYRVTALRTESIELVNLAESTQRLTLRLNPVVVDRADVNKDVNRDATRNSTRAATQPATAWPSLALEK